MDWPRCSGELILEKLSSRYEVDPKDFVAYDVWLKTKDCFKVLIATLLSQNSTDKGTYKAFEELERRIGVSPQKLASACEKEIGEAIRSIGIYNVKAKRIKEISNLLLEKYNGSLEQILDLPKDEARRSLISLPGVGEKTADVVLLTCRNYEYFPVDTHIKRISMRLGIKGSTYQEISKGLMELFQPKDYLRAHHLLIAHGRNTCKARRPLCERCAISECCKYYNTTYRVGKASSS